MNYYDARQRADTQPPIWDYTCMNDGDAWPIGFCAPTIPCPESRRNYGLEACADTCETCHGKRSIPNPDYCGGHASAQEAGECFARYIASQGADEFEYGDWTGCEHEAGGKRGDPECPNRLYHETHHYCPSCDFQSGERCDKPTKKGLKQKHPLGQQHALCDEHRTTEIFETMLPKSVGQITASW